MSGMRILYLFALMCVCASSSFNAEAQVRRGPEHGRTSARPRSAIAVGNLSSVVVTPEWRVYRRVPPPFVRQPGFFYEPFPWAAPIYPAPINPAPIYLAPLYTSVP